MKMSTALGTGTGMGLRAWKRMENESTFIRADLRYEHAIFSLLSPPLPLLHDSFISRSAVVGAGDDGVIMCR